MRVSCFAYAISRHPWGVEPGDALRDPEMRSDPVLIFRMIYSGLWQARLMVESLAKSGRVKALVYCMAIFARNYRRAKH